MGITLSQGETLLYDDLEVEAGHLAVGSTGTITQNQFNALCSFGFNLGVGALSQMLLMRFWDQAAAQILEMGFSGCRREGAGRTSPEDAKQNLALFSLQ